MGVFLGDISMKALPFFGSCGRISKRVAAGIVQVGLKPPFSKRFAKRLFLAGALNAHFEYLERQPSVSSSDVKLRDILRKPCSFPWFTRTSIMFLRLKSTLA